MRLFLLLALNCIFLNVAGSNNDYDLQGKTYRISDGDVSIFDGRKIKNGTLIISEGSYLLRVKKEGGTCLKIGDNTEVVVEGTLQLTPNGFKSYDIIRVVGRNVKIHGKGRITGDRYAHLGSEGEWGMGIRLDGSSNVTVSELTITDCWGDCIYIGGDSKNIQISNCQLRGSRRQGISITKADGVTVSNCKIADISGTNPQYAIDIEPNKRCVVDNVLIENITVTGCEGGFRAVIGKKGFGNARIGKVEILNCNVMAKSRQTIFLGGCDEAVVNNCVIETRKGEKPILSRKVGHMSEMNNKVIYK
jgi:parallel beta-helix repeat protein